VANLHSCVPAPRPAAGRHRLWPELRGVLGAPATAGTGSSAPVSRRPSGNDGRTHACGALAPPSRLPRRVTGPAAG